jgi:anthranilate phosphoribosyltransferase
MSYLNTLAQAKPGEHDFAKYVRILGKGKTGSRSLTEEEAYTAMSMILAGEVESLQVGAFLMLLRVKEESQEELTGFVRAVRDGIHAPTDIQLDLDWSSYAGKKKQLPWFLLSCFCLADQGIRLYMHGTLGHTEGRLYTQDVLQTLNIPIALNWDDVRTQLDDSNFSFMPLSQLCPPLQQIIDFRRLFGLRSPVHTLSRLINPLTAPYSMQSIFHPAYADSHQQAAQSLGQQDAAVFKGEGGEIERRPEAITTVKRVVDGTIEDEIWPKMTEGRQTPSDQLNVEHLKAVWQGNEDDEYGCQAIIGTLAIALRLLGKACDQSEAFTLAEHYWQHRNRSRLTR